MLIKEIMTKAVYTVSPDQSLKEAGQLLKEKRVSGLPVVNHEGEVIGIITLTDMLRVLDRIYRWKEVQKRFPDVSFSEMCDEERTGGKVRDIMTEQVVVLTEDQGLEAVMETMFERGLHTIPIVDKTGKLVGVVGKIDLVCACF